MQDYNELKDVDQEYLLKKMYLENKQFEYLPSCFKWNRFERISFDILKKFAKEKEIIFL